MQSHKLYPEVPDSLWSALGRGRVKKGGCGDVLLKLVLVVKAVRDGVGYFQTRPFPLVCHSVEGNTVIGNRQYHLLRLKNDSNVDESLSALHFTMLSNVLHQFLGYYPYLEHGVVVQRLLFQPKAYLVEAFAHVLDGILKR